MPTSLGRGIPTAGLKAILAVWHNQAVLSETEFRLNGELGELQRLAAEVAHFCRQRAAGEAVEFNLNLILEELFVNAVEHGGCNGMPDAIEVRLKSGDDALLVEFADRGKPFDPIAAATPALDAPLDERQPGGLGLHFVRQLARSLVYRRQGTWNCWTLRLPLSGTDNQ